MEEREFNLNQNSEELLRDGLIPGWSEVVVRFGLDGILPSDLSLLRGYYRAQRGIAQGERGKAEGIFDDLEQDPNFLDLEEEKGDLLTNIASYVRGGRN